MNDDLKRQVNLVSEERYPLTTDLTKLDKEIQRAAFREGAALMYELLTKQQLAMFAGVYHFEHE